MLKKYLPINFFLTTIIFTSIAWALASYFSYIAKLNYLIFPFIFLGMAGPTISALIIIFKSKNKDLIKDFYKRLSFRIIKPKFILLILIFTPFLIILSIFISMLFGFSTNQFALSSFSSDQVLKEVNLLSILIIVLLSCSLEEIGWRGYGIDSLNSKFNLLNTSLIFATIWSLWHIPAFFIKNGYFQNELWNAGIVQVFNYFITLYPITILINWLYIKNNRSVLIAIFAHSILNISYGFFKIDYYAKIILMMLLVLISLIVVFKEKNYFFETNQ